MKTYRVLLALLSFLALTQAKSTYEYNITRSVDRIKFWFDQVDFTADKIPLALTFVSKLLDNCFTDAAIEIIPGSPVGLAKLWHVVEKLVNSLQWSELPPLNITTFMQEYVDENPQGFAAIHDHLWLDAAYLDIIKFLETAGYPESEIMAGFDALYDLWGVHECIRPPNPSTNCPPWKSLPVRKTRSVQTDYRNSVSGFSTYQQQPGLPILCILGELNGLVGTDLYFIAELLITTVQEINVNPAFHVLLAKIGEPRKGDSFVKTRELPEVQDVLDDMDVRVGQNVRKLAGPLINGRWEDWKLANKLINIVEWLFWGH